MLDRMVYEVTEGGVFALLPDETQEKIHALPEEQVREAAQHVRTHPRPGYVPPAGRLLMNPCLAVQWLSLFEELQLPRTLRAYEPCAGASEPVILATDLYTEGRGAYTTVNLNRPLAAQLRDKLAKVRIPTRIIEADASSSEAHLESGSFDVACFHHAINDILQTAVSEPRGMDTRTVDWWPNERQMIEWLGEDADAGRLGEHARPALLQAVRQAIDLVPPGGALLFDHWTWEGHHQMDWFPWELFCNLVPMARTWIMEEKLPVTELSVAECDPQWWMFLRTQAA